MGFVQQIARRTPLGWLQLTHEKGRFVVALAGIAFADVLMFMQLGFQSALYDSNTRTHRALDADLVLISPQARNLVNLSTFPRQRMYQAQDVPGIASATAMYGSFAEWKNPQTRKKTAILVLGVDPQVSLFNQPDIVQQLPLLKLPDYVLFDRASRGQYDQTLAALDQGQIVSTEIDRHTIHLAGTFQVGASFATDGTVVMSDQSFLRLFPRRHPGAINLAALQLKPGYDAETVAQAVRSHLSDDVMVLTFEGFLAFEKEFWRNNTAIGFVFSLGTVMGFIVGIVLVYQVLSTDVSAHMSEYATFKAMGYRHLYLLSIVFEEAIILALLGFLPGVGASLGLYSLTRGATNLPLFMTTLRAIQILILTIVMCFISGAIAARKLQAADPADIF